MIIKETFIASLIKIAHLYVNVMFIDAIADTYLLPWLGRT